MTPGLQPLTTATRTLMPLGPKPPVSGLYPKTSVYPSSVTYPAVPTTLFAFSLLVNALTCTPVTEVQH